MAFVQFSKVSLAFGDRDILKSVSLNLAAGSKAALAGANGAGKSTLMKVIAGKISADSGDRAVQKGTRVSYLPQSGIIHQGRTLSEEAELAYGEIIKLLGEMEALGRELETAKDNDSRTASLVAEHHRIQEEIENSGYYRREASISMILTGLGFSSSDMDRQVEEFSGGWQMRIALAKMLLENPDILLLDEPTNYLDIEARAWLESWLQSYTGGYLLVSHDRFFLDSTVNEVFELFQGELKRYAGNYTSYEKIRAVELESLLKRYEAQQEEIAKTEALIRRFRYKASKAAFAQELIKRLDKIERIEIPESLKKISISFPPPPHAGRVALTLTSIGKSYGERRILSGLDLDLESGEKLLVVGRNGAGKTTLLRIIAGQDKAFAGNVKYGAGISAGYFSQDAAETLTGSQTVLDFMEAEAPTHLIPKVRDMLGAFLFRGDDVFKALTVLSGGEKSRLALLRMLLKPMNLLILDEPTNHLDLQSKDILLTCLKAFTGTVIFVSHDRGFMEALSTKTLELRAGKPHRLFYGDYHYYLDRVASEDDGVTHEENNRQAQQEAGAQVDAETGLDSIAANGGTADIDSVDADSNSTINNTARNSLESAAGGLSSLQGKLPQSILVKAGTPPILSAAERREQEKQRQTRIRRLEKQEAEIFALIETLEKEKALLEAELARPEVYSSGEKSKAVKAKLDQTTAAIDSGNRDWEEKAAELAELNSFKQ